MLRDFIGKLMMMGICATHYRGVDDIHATYPHAPEKKSPAREVLAIIDNAHNRGRQAPLSTLMPARIGSITTALSFGSAHSSQRARCSTTRPNASADSTPNVAKPI